MSEHALATTPKEIDEAYLDLRRVLQSGRSPEAIKLAIGLAKHDEKRLWNYLRAYASTELNYRDTSQLLAVNALWNNWQQDNDNSFVVHAALILASAPKGQSALDYYVRSVKPH